MLAIYGPLGGQIIRAIFMLYGSCSVPLYRQEIVLGLSHPRGVEIPFT